MTENDYAKGFQGDGRITAFLDSPFKWTKRAFARTTIELTKHADQRNYCPPSDAKAVCWCASGLIEKFYPEGAYYAQRHLEEVIFGHGNPMGTTIAAWNDNPLRTFADVRMAFEKAGL